MKSSFYHLFFILTWIFAFFLFSECSARFAPKIYLDSTVFVALAGEDLTVGGVIMKATNKSIDTMTCADPSNKQIHHTDIPATVGQTQTSHRIVVSVKLKNLTISGEYVCQYQTARVYWFLQVRDVGYKEPRMVNYTESITVASIAALLLVFSVAGSVYVFRGNWKEQITNCGKTGREQNQNGEERNTSEIEEDAQIIKAPSTSFYCSLQPRPRSIYDVLEHSGANMEQEQRKSKTSETKPHIMTQQTTQLKDEDVFESVYENF